MIDSPVVFRGGAVLDGSGSAAVRSDLLVSGTEIVAFGVPEKIRQQLGGYRQVRDIDCTGMVVAPGFIDAHSHSDLQVLEGRTEKLVQGVTTEVVGNCGFSPYPLPANKTHLREFANGIFCGDDSWGWDSAGEYLAQAAGSPAATVVSLVGHGSLRIKVAGATGRTLTLTELDAACALLDDSLAQGAAGLSSGLMYAPGSGASMNELIALCRVVARRNGVYATHMRSYAGQLLEAVEEQLTIARLSGCSLQISHLQAVGEENWPLQSRAIGMIEEAAREGVDVTFDAYPWVAGSTVLTQLLPQTALDGGLLALQARLSEPDKRKAIWIEVEREHGSRWKDLVISSAGKHPNDLVGRTLSDLASERGVPPGEAVLQILSEEEGEVTILEFNQSQENLRSLLTHELCMVVTDGLYSRGRPHPRLYGTFPLLLGEIARERNWLSLAAAVHKITAKPAAKFRLSNRGLLAPGRAADITVFDPRTIDSRASYDRPTEPPIGIQAVMRNGKFLSGPAVA